MMRFEGPEVLDQFETLFGIKREEMTPSQMLWLIKFAKHIRGRCRSNAALKNHLQHTFTNFSIREVDREWKGKPYKALEFATKYHPSVAEESDTEE